MWEHFEERESRRKIIISCNEDNCNGVFTHASWLSDHSPRIEEKCSECERFISVKLHNIDESRIVSREVIDE